MPSECAFLTLDLSGTLRGESGRILLFLSPWILLLAGTALPGDCRPGIALTAVQGLIAVVMIVCLRVVNAGFSGPSPLIPPAIAQPAEGSPVLPSGALFDGKVQLSSFTGTIRPQPDAQGPALPVLDLWLNWEVAARMEKAYDLAVLPVAPDGQAAPKATIQAPFENRYPMTCWNPDLGELHDKIEVPLFKSESGDWWVSFSVIDAQTGQTLEVVTPDGLHDHQVGLGPFRQ